MRGPAEQPRSPSSPPPRHRPDSLLGEGSLCPQEAVPQFAMET